MSRVAGSYESVVRGVSQQVPQDRRSGQMFEQMNMISDPVRGLARRHGSLMQDEKVLRSYVPSDYINLLADTAGHKVFAFQSNGKDYDLIFRTRASTGQNDEDFCFCYSKDDRQFIPVVLGDSALMTSLKQGGVSAQTNVGSYVFLAGNDIVTDTDEFNAVESTKQYMVAWVRTGAYSRTFRIRMARADGSTLVASTTTPASSYPGVLDTSDIASSDPAYTKKVNDATNAYNSAVTQWIGTSAAGIVPAAIATALKASVDAVASGQGLVTSVVDSTLTFDTSAMSNPIVDILCEDGGDGTLFRGVGLSVSAAELVSTVHQAGKIIRVQPKKNDSTDVYYLKATPKVNNATGWTQVQWQEAAGYVTTPKDLYGMGIVVGGTLYIGGSADELTALCGGDHPAPVPNGVGDRVSCPVPTFLGRKIDYLSVFQDRLVVGSGAVLYYSRTGDYQNFWRQSVLTIDDADPIEMFALGAEDDTIKASTTYDRNALIFGRRKQYVVSGRSPLTPKTASIVVQSAHEDAVDSVPVNAGNFVFYNKYRNGVSSSHQVQIGQLVDTPESYEISKQLDKYLVGRPSELVAITAPNIVFMRTESMRDRVYVYTYLDSAAGSERLFDSWSTWSWSPGVGSLMGLSRHEGDVLMYYIRRGQSPTDEVEQTYIACDRFVVDTALSDRPYLDSLRPEDAPGTLTADNTMTADASVAFDSTVPEFMLGSPFSELDDLEAQYPDSSAARWLGWNYDAFATPTNPYILDRNNKAIVTGRLTVTRLAVSVADTGGLRVTMESSGVEKTPTDFTGRLIGQSTNLVGRQPIVTTAVTVPLGKETRAFKYTMWARRWLPLTVTAIEWAGQFFNNTRRV